MIKRFIKRKNMTVTQAINCYGESCAAVRTINLNECCQINAQQVRLTMSRRYQEYLGVSDAHLVQIQIEFEKRYKAMSSENTVFEIENVGNALLENSIVSCADIIIGHGDLEFCVPFPKQDDPILAADLIKYTPQYDWLKSHYKLIPFGKQLYSNLVKEMGQTFKGKIPGRHIWHTYKDQ